MQSSKKTKKLESGFLSTSRDLLRDRKRRKVVPKEDGSASYARRYFLLNGASDECEARRADKRQHGDGVDGARTIKHTLTSGQVQVSNGLFPRCASLAATSQIELSSAAITAFVSL